jgi:hypothetical protein
MQKQHDLADGDLIAPGTDNFLLAFAPDVFNLLKRVGGLLNDFKEFFTEARNQPLGINRSDALHHSTCQILFHAFPCVGRHGLQVKRFELTTVFLIDNPIAFGP